MVQKLSCNTLSCVFPILFQEYLPPDVGLGHDVLESIAELKKRLNLETHEVTHGKCNGCLYI